MVGRLLSYLGLRRLARTLENKLKTSRFRPANPVTPKAVRRAMQLIREGKEAKGLDYYEFGIFQGYTLWKAQQIAAELGFDQMRFIGFDSFVGLPEIEEIDEFKGDFEKGQFSVSRSLVESRLSDQGVDWQRTLLIEGLFDDVLRTGAHLDHHLRPAALIVIDSDLYASASGALALAADVIVDGTVILFDDWDCFDALEDRGERRAFREFLNDHPQWRAQELFAFDKTRAFRMQRLENHPMSTPSPESSPYPR